MGARYLSDYEDDARRANEAVSSQNDLIKQLRVRIAELEAALEIALKSGEGLSRLAKQRIALENHKEADAPLVVGVAELERLHDD